MSPIVEVVVGDNVKTSIIGDEINNDEVEEVQKDATPTPATPRVIVIIKRRRGLQVIAKLPPLPCPPPL